MFQEQEQFSAWQLGRGVLGTFLFLQVHPCREINPGPSPVTQEHLPNNKTPVADGLSRLQVPDSMSSCETVGVQADTLVNSIYFRLSTGTGGFVLLSFLILAFVIYR